MGDGVRASVRVRARASAKVRVRLRLRVRCPTTPAHELLHTCVAAHAAAARREAAW